MEKWIVWLEPIVESFAWIELREMPQWSDGPNPVNRTVNLLIQKKIIQPQDYDQMFIDFGNIKTFLKGQPNIYLTNGINQNYRFKSDGCLFLQI